MKLANGDRYEQNEMKVSCLKLSYLHVLSTIMKPFVALKLHNNMYLYPSLPITAKTLLPYNSLRSAYSPPDITRSLPEVLPLDLSRRTYFPYS